MSEPDGLGDFLEQQPPFAHDGAHDGAHSPDQSAPSRPFSSRAGVQTVDPLLPLALNNRAICYQNLGMCAALVPCEL